MSSGRQGDDRQDRGGQGRDGQGTEGQSRDRRARGPSALARFVPRLTRPALRGFAKAEASLLLDWEAIVGPEVAAYTQPLKLAFPTREEKRNATLHLRVDPAMALDLQHSGDLLAERVNMYFGYALVARLRLKQGPVRRKAARPPLQVPAPLPPARAAGLNRRLSAIDDPGLREALERLGTAVGSKGGK